MAAAGPRAPCSTLSFRPAAAAEAERAAPPQAAARSRRNRRHTQAPVATTQTDSTATALSKRRAGEPGLLEPAAAGSGACSSGGEWQVTVPGIGRELEAEVPDSAAAARRAAHAERVSANLGAWVKALESVYEEPEAWDLDGLTLVRRLPAEQGAGSSGKAPPAEAAAQATDGQPAGQATLAAAAQTGKRARRQTMASAAAEGRPAAPPKADSLAAPVRQTMAASALPLIAEDVTGHDSADCKTGREAQAARPAAVHEEGEGAAKQPQPVQAAAAPPTPPRQQLPAAAKPGGGRGKRRRAAPAQLCAMDADGVENGAAVSQEAQPARR